MRRREAERTNASGTKKSRGSVRRSAARKGTQEEAVHVKDDVRDGGPCAGWRRCRGHRLVGGGSGAHWCAMRAGGERERSDWLASLESRVMIGQRAPSRADSAATQVTNEGGDQVFFPF
jgi:hypothetical protein